MRNKLKLTVLVGSFLLSIITYAEGNKIKKEIADGGAVFHSRSILLNLGFGIPSFQTPYSNSFALPKFSLALEFGVHKWVSVGGFIAFNYWASNGEDQYNKYVQTQPDFLFGAKGSFHFSAIGNEKWNWNINTDKVDIYASAFIGVGSYLWNREITSKIDGSIQTSTSSNPYPVVGISAGIRYLFTPTFGVYAEAGYTPLGIINGGFTFKIR
jgi:hypothetical protein